MRRSIMFLTVLSILLSACSALFAQDSLKISTLARISGEAWTRVDKIAVAENYAYVTASQAGIKIVDISRPIDPREVAAVRAGEVWDVAVSDNLLLFSTSNQLSFYDVADPLNPDSITTMNLSGIRGIAVNEDRVFLARGEDGILILNISNPAEPAVWSELDTPGFALQAVPEAGGRVVLIADREGGLRIVDFSDPDAPVESGSLEPEGETRNVAIRGNWAYLGESEVVSRVDHRNHEGPERVSTRSLDGRRITAITADGDYVYCAAESRGIYILSGDDDMEIVGQCIWDAPNDFQLQDDLLLCATGGSFMIIDVSDPAEPFPVGITGRSLRYISSESVGDYAYVNTSGAGMLIYNLSEPAAPALVWRQPIREAYWGKEIEIRDDTLFLISGYDNYWWLMIADISQPDNPEWFSSTRVQFLANRIAVGSRYAFVSSSDYQGITVISISSLESPQDIGDINVENSGDIYDTALHGNHLFIATERRGVLVLDVSDPVDARVVSQVNENGSYLVTVFDDLAFIPNGNTLNIYDVTDPTNAELLSSLNLRGARVTQVEDGIAYVAHHSSGLYMLNISDPENPQIIGYYNTPENALDVSASQGIAFVADDQAAGIYDCSEALTAPSDPVVQPLSFSLEAAYPNPFNSTTTINYTLPTASHISLKLYNTLGQQC